MELLGRKNPQADLSHLGITEPTQNWNLKPAALIERTLVSGDGHLNSTGALAINTGEFTGRSPEDRFIVIDDITKDSVHWGSINKPVSPENFDKLYDGVINYLNEQEEIYIRDGYACSYVKYRLNVRVITQYPWQSLFVNNMFLRPSESALNSFVPDWQVISAPGFRANGEEDGIRQHNFAIINFTKKMIIIGGTAYTGEIKKGIFSVLNFILPTERNILSMHCSANVGEKGDTALFFGLSGTGKTTLSTDPKRKLIGDDEHGWSESSVFNFEGGCYAKCIDLSASKEPQIFNAIKFGALLENIKFFPGTCVVDYSDKSITENTRVSYPINHINNIVFNSRGDVPQNIFFLTCDAFGVLPPITKLTPQQAMYHFISGYTAKVAGTEAGITEPVTAFSACFGLPFLPLHPGKYAEMLGDKLKQGNKRADGQIKVWLINTGWSGGPYGEGNRIALPYTRAMINAALNGDLDEVEYHTHPIFGLAMPKKCSDVPNGMLNPIDTWASEHDYVEKANSLAQKFIDNFKQFEEGVSEEILSAAPKVMEDVLSS